ncbi:MAG: ornithine carbamoyltransferase [Gemmataceae bacterium]
MNPLAPPPRHLLNLADIPTDVLQQLLVDAARLKKARAQGVPVNTLAGKVIALIFEKPSMRTRVSFEAGVAQLGGTALFLPGNEVGLGWRESLADFARTMARFVDGMVLRVFKQSTVEEVAKWSSVPVINGLSDWSHPCQALADLLTIQEHCGGIAGKTVAFIGDGNNVARSLAVGCGKLGARFVLGCPPGYGFDDRFRTVFEQSTPAHAAPLLELNDPVAAMAEADVVYADVWTSMGQEAEREERLRTFSKFQLNAALMKKAPAHCKILHCLPAHRGEEITDEVIDGPASLVFDQAENRLHTQKAALEWLLNPPSR